MELENFVLSGLILLLVASLTVAVFKRIGLGAVLGLLVAGVLVGPHTAGPLVTTQVEDLRNFTEFGVVLLLFLIGLEIRPSRLWQMRHEVLGLGSLQIVLTGLAIAGYFALRQPQQDGALLIGMILAMSSTAFVMQILRDNGEIASAHGRASLSVLLMQDLAVIPLLAVLPLLATTSALPGLPGWERLAAILGVFGLIVASGRYLVPLVLDRLASHNNREAFLLVTMLAVFFAAWATAKIGLSMALGAFIMGMLLSTSRYNLQIQALIEPFKGLLLSMFFVAIGMSMDLGLIMQHAGLFLETTLVVIAMKASIMLLVGLFFRIRRAVIVRMSFMLAQCGEFGFVLLGSTHALGIIDESAFVSMTGIISATMLVTPLMVRIGNMLATRIETGNASSRSEPGLDPQAAVPKVIIGGYGRVGHVIATLLHSSGVPFIVFDTDPVCVAKGRSDGYPVYFGDISDIDLLAAAGTERVALVVLTVNQVHTAMNSVTHLRSLYPQVPVIARARDLQDSAHLLEAGATMAYPEVIESSLQLAANALEMVGLPQENVDLLMRDVRGGSYALVREPDQKDP